MRILAKQTHGLLHGGGYDSSMLLDYLVCGCSQILVPTLEEPVVTLGVAHIDYGHLAAKAERAAIMTQMSPPYIQTEIASFLVLTTADVPQTGQLFTGNHEDSPEIKGRNEILIRKMVDCGFNNIWIGADPVAEGVEPMADCTATFFQDLQATLSKEVGRAIRLHTPFLEFDYNVYQTMLVQRMSSDRFILSNAMTCWTPDDRKSSVSAMHCGVCSHCEKRNRLLQKVASCC